MDRTIVVGIAVSVAGLLLATVVLLYVLSTLTTPQVVRLVSLVPSHGAIILEDAGDSSTLNVRGYYSDLSLEDLDLDFVTYESTDPTVVTVSQDGTVVAAGAGSADILIDFGGFSTRVHALVFGDIPAIPPIDPAMVGVIPGLDIEARAVLNRVIIELQPGYDVDTARDIALDLGGEVLFSYRTSPVHVVEFDPEEHTLNEVIDGVESDHRVAGAYPDILFETFDHGIDTLSLDGSLGDAYRHAGFDRAWRMVERVPDLHTVIISVIDTGIVNQLTSNQPIVGLEFDPLRVLSMPFRVPVDFERWRFTSPLRKTDSHAAAITSIIAAANGNETPSGIPKDHNLSGIVTSVDDLPYFLIGTSQLEHIGNVVGTTVQAASNLLLALQTIMLYDHAIDAVNMSWGGLATAIPDPLEGLLLGPILALGNVVFVPAAGNCQVDAREYVPANFSLLSPNVITVGGASRDYSRRWFSQPAWCQADRLNGNSSAYGDAVTISAPSEGVWHVDTDLNMYLEDDGTSFAAPMVTGTIALLRAIDSGLSPRQIKPLLVDTADRKTVCTSEVNIDRCPDADREPWYFLRADKAVAKLISDSVDAEVSDERVTVPSDTQRVVGNGFEIGVEIENTGTIVWPFYAEAVVRSPTGGELTMGGREIAIAPGKSHPFRWGFWPNRGGCWDIRVRVWIDGDEDSHLRAAIAENNGLGPDAKDVGLIADSGWWQDVLEVRADDSDSDIQCSSEPQTVPLPKGLAQVDANVLLLADTSGSMGGAKIEALRQAVDTFVTRMYDIRFQGKGGTEAEADFVGMSDFDDTYQGVISIGPIDSNGADLDTWQDAVDRLDADGGTAFYDAIITSVDILTNQGAPARNNILIALTDGLDQSSNSSLGDAKSALGESSVTLFALALGEPGGAGDYDLDILRDLADSTGGAAYAADTENLAGLYQLFSTIFETEP